MLAHAPQTQALVWYKYVLAAQARDWVIAREVKVSSKTTLVSYSKNVSKCKSTFFRKPSRYHHLSTYEVHTSWNAASCRKMKPCKVFVLDGQARYEWTMSNQQWGKLSCYLEQKHYLIVHRLSIFPWSLMQSSLFLNEMIWSSPSATSCVWALVKGAKSPITIGNCNVVMGDR